MMVLGNWFMWTKINGFGILRCLDRVLVNEAWVMSYPHSVVRASPWGISDHSAFLLSLGNSLRCKFLAFRFFNYLAEVDGFVDIGASVWIRHRGVSPLVSLMRNLQALKLVLRS